MDELRDTQYNLPIGTDCISRQAAIDVLKNRWLKTRNYEGIGEDIAEECEIYLMAMPSVQPEIIYCKDCMYTDGDKPIADGRYWCMLHGTFMYYCSDAERGSDETNRRRRATGR